jgi:hypothetical protein
VVPAGLPTIQRKDIGALELAFVCAISNASLAFVLLANRLVQINAA